MNKQHCDICDKVDASIRSKHVIFLTYEGRSLRVEVAALQSDHYIELCGTDLDKLLQAVLDARQAARAVQLPAADGPTK